MPNIKQEGPITIKKEDMSEGVTIKKEGSERVTIKTEDSSNSITKEELSDSIAVKVEPCSSTDGLVMESIILPDFIKNEPCSNSSDENTDDGRATSPKVEVKRRKVMGSQVKKCYY